MSDDDDWLRWHQGEIRDMFRHSWIMFGVGWLGGAVFSAVCFIN